MTEIEKLLNGRRISRNQYAATKQQFDAAYAEADDDMKAKIDGLMRSSQNYSSANPMNNRSAREYQTQLYQNALSIMNGDYAGAAPSAGISTPNMFNGYSHAENTNNANDVTSRYMSHALGKKTTESTGTTSGKGGFYRFNGLEGIENGYLYDTDTLDDRMEAMAQVLGTNIINALNSNKKIVGANADNLQLALNMLSSGSYKGNIKQLGRIAQLAGVDFTSFLNYFGALMPGQSAAEKNKRAREGEGWEFISGGDYGDVFNKMITDNNWIVGKKDGKTYVLNSDYSGPITGKSGAFINTDWRDANLGQGWAMDENGQFITGDMAQHYNNLQSPWYNAIKGNLDAQGNGKRWYTDNRAYNQYTDQSDKDIINKLAKQLHNKSIADVSSYFNGADVIATVNGNDFSPYETEYGHLKLDDPNFTFYFKDKSGNYRSGNLKDVIKNVGDVTLTSNQALKNLANYSHGDVDLDALNWSMEKGLNDYDINGKGDWHNAFSWDTTFTDGWSGEQMTSDSSATNDRGWTLLLNFGIASLWKDLAQGTNPFKNIQNSPEKFARLMLYAYTNQDKLSNSNKKADRELYQALAHMLSTNEGIQSLGYLFNRAQKSGALDLDDRYAQALRLFIHNYKTMLGGGAQTSIQTEEPKVKSDKQGGILKAAIGAALDINGNPMPEDGVESVAAEMRRKGNKTTKAWNKTVDAAEEHGRSIERQAAIDANKWTSADSMRAAALVTDVGGLIAAMTGAATAGVGNAVAVGTGIGSTVMDAIADFSDDKVSKGQAWKNVGINLGFAAAAAVGGKAPKIIKTAMKIVPKIMVGLGTAGIALDPEVHETVAKMTSGKSLNVNDWRNIMLVLRMGTGLGTMGTMKYKTNKAQKIYQEKYNKNLEKLGVSTDLDPDIKLVRNSENQIVELDKNIYNEVKSVLTGKKGDADKALAILTKSKEEGGAGLTKEAAESLLQKVGGQKSGWKEKIKFWKNADDIDGLVDVDEATAKMGMVSDDVSAQARLQTIEQIRKEARNSHNLFKFANKWEGKSWAEANNHGLNTALLQAAQQGHAYSNIAELTKGDKKLLGDITPAQAAKLLGIDENNLTARVQAYDEASAKVAEAQQKVDAAKEALNSSFAPNEQLAQLHQAAMDELANAKAAQKSLQDELSGIGQLIKDLEDKFQNPIVMGRYDQLEGNSVLTHNQAALQRLLAAEDAVSSAKADLDALAADPMYSAAFKRNKAGNIILNKNANKMLLSQVLDKFDAVTKAEAALAEAKKSHANKLLETALWDEYQSAQAKTQELQARFNEGELALNDKQAMIADLRRQLSESRNNSRQLKDDVNTAESVFNSRNNDLSLAGRGELLGTVRKGFTVNIDGSDVKVEKGAEIRSYRHLRDAAKDAVLAQENMKELSTAQIKEIFPSNLVSKIKGAAIDTSTGEIAIWKKGGLLAQRAKGIGTPELIKVLHKELAGVGYSKLEIDRLMVEKSGDEIRRLISRRRKSKK